MPQSFKLSATQIDKLSRIARTHDDVELFNITVDGSNGIGPVVTVEWDSDDLAYRVDITEVDSW